MRSRKFNVLVRAPVLSLSISSDAVRHSHDVSLCKKDVRDNVRLWVDGYYIPPDSSPVRENASNLLALSLHQV